jgi:hypothetical protein
VRRWRTQFKGYWKRAVDALDRALRDLLAPIYPELKRIRLTDYKVTGSEAGTAAKMLIDSSDWLRN